MSEKPVMSSTSLTVGWMLVGGEEEPQPRGAHVRDVREVQHDLRRVAELEPGLELRRGYGVNASADGNGQRASFCISFDLHILSPL